MYRRCHVCEGSLGSNDVIPSMPVGRRLAFDTERGRLWVVCPRCSEWNLTALDERWEAVEACEREFAGATVRASSRHVGLARVRGVELLRVGAAVHRDELANWRYGARLRRRRRRASVLITSAGVVSGAAVGGVLIAGAKVGSLAFVGWGLAMAGGWAHEVVRSVGRARGASFVGPAGVRLRLTGPDFEAIRLTKTSTAKGIRRIGAIAGRYREEVQYHGDALLRLLSAALPRLNGRGASDDELRSATRLVDAEESFAADVARRGGKPMPAWQRIAVVNWPPDDLLASMEPIPRLAFEMAVTEEVERRALAGEAEALEGRWRVAEEVAEIADSLFLPAFVTDWLARHGRERRRT